GIINAPLWGPEGIERWLERSSFFNLDRVRAPIRFEYHGYNVPGHWDDYALLRRMSRPADFVLIPGEEHSATTAWGYQTYRVGLADWFDFWLNDREDPVSANS